jgi:cytochrome b6-f complex iron-sulfur subunit
MIENPRRAFAGTAACVALGIVVRCKGPPAAPVVTVPLADLPAGTRTVVSAGGRPVELHHGPQGVSGRLLLCTHMGCVVRWADAGRIYICPCHDGRLDASGKPFAGPPPGALDEVPVRIEGAIVRVG